MKTRILCLPPGRLEPGMLTAAAIYLRPGVELLPAECELDADLIESIRRRPIRFVMIRIEDLRDEEQIAHDVATAASRVAYIFRGTGSEVRTELGGVVDAYRREQTS